MDFWNILILQPMTNILLLLYAWLGQSFVLSIVVFTILVRLITIPLTIRQQQSTKSMQALQPKMKELQKKYKNDKEALLQAQQKLYAEHGVSPLGGCLPTLIQFPILIGLYQAIIYSLASSPTQLLDLSHRIYPVQPFSSLSTLVPLENQLRLFGGLSLNMGMPPAAPISFVIAALVFGTTYLQQKLITPPTQSADKEDATAQMTNTMQIMMPLMFGYFALSFAVGLSIYFIVSNLIGVVQYWWINRQPLRLAPAAAGSAPTLAKAAEEVSASEPDGRGRKEIERPIPASRKPTAKSGKPRAAKAKK